MIELEKINKNEFSIIDAIEKLNLIKSRSEIKRTIKSNGVKVNDNTYYQTDYSLNNFLSANEIKITVGKKKIGLIKII